MGGLYSELLKAHWEVRENKTGDGGIVVHNTAAISKLLSPPPQPSVTHSHTLRDKKKHTNTHTHLPSMDKGWIKVNQKRENQREKNESLFS